MVWVLEPAPEHFADFVSELHHSVVLVGSEIATIPGEIQGGLHFIQFSVAIGEFAEAVELPLGGLAISGRSPEVRGRGGPDSPPHPGGMPDNSPIL